MTIRRYAVMFSQMALDHWVRVFPDGQIEQYQIAAEL
jgi:hypothetical protein